LLQNNRRFWEYFFDLEEAFEALFLALFKLRLFLFLNISLFIILDWSLQENVLAVLIRSWEPIKNVTSVSAIVLSESI